MRNKTADFSIMYIAPMKPSDLDIHEKIFCIAPKLLGILFSDCCKIKVQLHGSTKSFEKSQ